MGMTTPSAVLLLATACLVSCSGVPTVRPPDACQTCECWAEVEDRCGIAKPPKDVAYHECIEPAEGECLAHCTLCWSTQ